MRGPNESERKRILWRRYPQYIIEKKNPYEILLTEDAPPEVVESFNLFKAFLKEKG